VPIKQREALEFVGIAEEAMVKGFPFEVPKEYAELPQLLVGACHLSRPPDLRLATLRLELSHTHLLRGGECQILEAHANKHTHTHTHTHTHKQQEVAVAATAAAAAAAGAQLDPPSPHAPQLPLQGRAKLEMKASATNTPDGKQEKVFTIILDGLNAPVSAGAFMDLGACSHV